MRICQICSTRNEDTSLACSACGATLTGVKQSVACRQLPALRTRLSKDCPSCGAENEPLAGTCRVCGDSLISVLPVRRKSAAEKRLFFTDDGGIMLMIRADGSVLGRDLLKSPYVSKEHVSISFDGQDYLLMDLGSLNGTWINGAAIKAGEWAKVGDRDTVAIANLRYTVSVEDKKDGKR